MNSPAWSRLETIIDDLRAISTLIFSNAVRIENSGIIRDETGIAFYLERQIDSLADSLTAISDELTQATDNKTDLHDVASK